MSKYESEISDFFQAYLTCALWSSTCDDGEPLDYQYTTEDLSDDCHASMFEDCINFFTANNTLLSHAIEKYDYSYSQAGHDFWLTRNGHGAGFWDRGLNDLGDKLTLAAKSYGSCDLYVGDDGKIYC